ncbi:Uncharacterized protein TCM_038703 [Theobroma cacao]|uniref:RNA-dependent RNA polymerase n=1 Tax=Theobroma cacao TaxID=3641 RepID=A0A061GRC0_THECC|nr:Uncharacterized protein TCM_038703 [Theobroma cacao]
MSAMNEEIQRRQYEDLDSLLIVSREKWAFNIGYFCTDLLHSIMIRRITESQSMDHELWFAISKSKAQLSKYWNGQESVKLQTLLDMFRGGNFQQLGDVAKMTLVLIVNNILFGQDYCRRVTRWLLSLVEDIDAWNVFPWGHYAMKAIMALRKIVAPSGSKDNVYPRMCRWDYNQKSKNFFRLCALETLEPTADEAFWEYFVDLDVPLSEGHEYMPIRHMEDRSDWGLGARQKRKSLKEKRAFGGTKWMRTAAALVDELSGPELMDEGDDHGQGNEQSLDHAPVTPKPPTGLPQTQSGNDPSFRKGTTSPQASIVCRSDDRSLSIDSADLEHDDANDGHHHEPGVDIDDDILGADGEHVTNVNDVVDEAMAVDVTFQSDDVEGEHVPLPESIIDASIGGDGELDLIVAEGERLPPVDAFVDAAVGTIVLYRGSTPNAVEIRSSSPESSVVHHGAVEISDPIERAWLKMASKYMKTIEDYEAFKKDESTRRNIGILGDQGVNFFITLKDPNEEMTSEHIDVCLSLLCKTPSVCCTPNFQQKMPEPQCRFQMSYEGMWRVKGQHMPKNGKMWISSSLIATLDNGVRAGQMTPLMTMMPFICHQVDYFNNIRRKRRDLTSIPLDIHLPKVKVYRQNDSVSCGMFMIGSEQFNCYAWRVTTFNLLYMVCQNNSLVIHGGSNAYSMRILTFCLSKRRGSSCSEAFPSIPREAYIGLSTLCMKFGNSLGFRDQAISAEFATLHYMAVDFAKITAPAEMARSLKPREFPNFMQTVDKPMYASLGVLGKLYRATINSIMQARSKFDRPSLWIDI